MKDLGDIYPMPRGGAARNVSSQVFCSVTTFLPRHFLQDWNTTEKGVK